MTDNAQNFYRAEWDKPYLTPSIANVLLRRTPFHARLECPFYGPVSRTPTTAMNEGSIVDGLVLGAGPKVVVIHAERLATKVVKKFRDNAESAGKIVMKIADWERCNDAAKKAKVSFPEDARIALEKGTIKERLFWGSGRSRVPCSTEPDVHHGDIVLDLKRTRIVPTGHNWRRHASNMGYHIQCAATLEATKAKRFGWIVVEADPPHCAVVHWATTAFIDVGKRDWHLARDIWHDCVTSGIFPAYQSEDIDPAPWLISDEGDTMTFTEDTEA